MKIWFQKDPQRDPLKMAVGATNVTALYNGAVKLWPDDNKKICGVLFKYVGNDPTNDLPKMAYFNLAFKDLVNGSPPTTEIGEFARRCTWVYPKNSYFQVGSRKFQMGRNPEGERYGYGQNAYGDGFYFCNSDDPVEYYSVASGGASFRIKDLNIISSSTYGTSSYSNRPNAYNNFNDCISTKKKDVYMFLSFSYFSNNPNNPYSLQLPYRKEFPLGTRVKVNIEVPAGYSGIYLCDKYNFGSYSNDTIFLSEGVDYCKNTSYKDYMPAKERLFAPFPLLKGLTVKVFNTSKKANGQCVISALPASGGGKLASFALNCAPSGTQLEDRSIKSIKLPYFSQLDRPATDAFWKGAYGCIFDFTNNTNGADQTRMCIEFAYPNAVKGSFDFEIVGVQEAFFE